MPQCLVGDLLAQQRHQQLVPARLGRRPLRHQLSRCLRELGAQQQAQQLSRRGVRRMVGEARRCQLRDRITDRRHLAVGEAVAAEDRSFAGQQADVESPGSCREPLEGRKELMLLRLQEIVVALGDGAQHDLEVVEVVALGQGARGSLRRFLHSISSISHRPDHDV